MNPVVTEQEPEPWVYRLRDVFRIAARNHIWELNCLRIAIALRKMLVRRGIEPQLRIGVNKTSGEIMAHAWLELGGKVISEHDGVLERYQPFPVDRERG